MKPLRPRDQVNYVPMTYPEPIDFSDLTPEEAQLPKHVFVKTKIRDAIDAQNKKLRRAKPRVPKTSRDHEIASYHLQKAA